MTCCIRKVVVIRPLRAPPNSCSIPTPLCAGSISPRTIGSAPHPSKCWTPLIHSHNPLRESCVFSSTLSGRSFPLHFSSNSCAPELNLLWPGQESCMQFGRIFGICLMGLGILLLVLQGAFYVSS